MNVKYVRACMYVNRLTLEFDTWKPPQQNKQLTASLKHLANIYQHISMRSLRVTHMAPAHAAH